MTLRDWRPIPAGGEHLSAPEGNRAHRRTEILRALNNLRGEQGVTVDVGAAVSDSEGIPREATIHIADIPSRDWNRVLEQVYVLWRMRIDSFTLITIGGEFLVTKEDRASLRAFERWTEHPVAVTSEKNVGMSVGGIGSPAALSIAERFLDEGARQEIGGLALGEVRKRKEQIATETHELFGAIDALRAREMELLGKDRLPREKRGLEDALARLSATLDFRGFLDRLRQHSFFVSYSRRDEAVVTPMVRALAGLGGDMFQDVSVVRGAPIEKATGQGAEMKKFSIARHLLEPPGTTRGTVPGTSWDSTLEKEQGASGYTLLYLSGAAVERFGEVAKEVNRALEMNQLILPIAIDDPGTLRSGLEKVKREGDHRERAVAISLMATDWMILPGEDIRLHPGDAAREAVIQIEVLERERAARPESAVASVEERAGEILPGIVKGGTYTVGEIEQAVGVLYERTRENVDSILIDGTCDDRGRNRRFQVRGAVVQRYDTGSGPGKPDWRINWIDMSSGERLPALSGDSVVSNISLRYFL